jgi:O-antigen/teichoic acid export membrane protein
MSTGKAGVPDFRGSPSMLIVGRLAATALSLISAPIIARAIGPVGRGETAAATALFLIVPVLIGIGMPMEIRRLSAVLTDDAALRSARRVNALMNIGAVALAAACYFSFFLTFDPFARVVAASGVALSALPASWALDVSVLMARQRFAAVAFMQVMQPAAYVILVVVFWGAGCLSVATVLIAFTLGNVANFIAGRFLTRAATRDALMPYRPLLRKSIDFYGATVAQIASSRLDQVLALPIIGAQQAGYYSVAVTVGSVPLVLGFALSGSYYRATAQAEGVERLHLQIAAVRSAIATALMFCPFLALAAVPLVPLVFGDDFRAALPATMFAIVAGGAQLVAFVASSAVAADGRGTLLTWAQTLGLVVDILALVLFGHIAGALGAAIASALGFAATVLILAASLRVNPSALLPRGADFIVSIRRLWRE